MLKKIKISLYVILFVFMLSLGVNTANSVVYDDKNNPGVGDGGSTGGAGSGTKWPGQPTYINAIRVRVFRNGTSILTQSGYYILSNNDRGCYSSVSAKHCETTGYNYSSVDSAEGATCGTAAETIKFGCIVSSNLSNTFRTREFDGSFLDDYLRLNQYKNLKIILANIGYGVSDAKEGDVVIVEPATRVLCADNYYFGTSTAMMKINISYRGPKGNMCSANDNYYNGRTGRTFQNLFQSMSTALKISEHSEYQGNGRYSGFGFFQYNVSDLGYVQPQFGSLKINKTNSNNDVLAQLTDSTTPKFQLYSDRNCTQKVGSEFETTNVVSNLALGTYYLKETQTKKGYHLPARGEKWYCEAITITSGQNRITVENKTECEYRFNSNMTMKQRIDLYNLIKMNYSQDFNALLDMNNKTASAACKNIQIQKSYTRSCLASSSTSTNSSNFSVNNISMYTERYGEYTFCLTKYNLVNNLGTTAFNNIKSGQAIISTDSNVATATLNRVCYNFGDSTITNYEYNNFSYSNYIEDDASIDGTKLLKNETSSGTSDNKTITTTYTLPLMYASNKDGKVYYGACPPGEYCKVLGRGTISKFNLRPGTYDLKFDIKLRREKLGSLDATNSSDCEYTVENELIDYNNKLSIEFRPVNTDSDALFLSKDGTGERKIGSNWSSEEDRNFVLKEKNNSYNKNKEEPLYKITLTPETIKQIREDNKSKTYDDYNMTCLEDGTICISNYLTCLQNRGVLQIKDRKNIDKFRSSQATCRI